MSSFGAPVKVLAGLTAVVLLAHLVILQSRPSSLQASERSLAKPFSTRSVALAPVAVDSPAPQPAVAPARLAPIAPAVPPPVRPTPAPKATPAIAKAVTASAQPAAQQAVAGLPDTFVTGPISPPQSPGAVGGPSEPFRVLPEPDSSPDVATPANPQIPPASAATPSRTAGNPTQAVAITAPGVPSAARVEASKAPPSLANAPANPTVLPKSDPAAPSAIPAPKVAYTLPGSTRLKYNVKATKDGLGFDARAELLWQQDGSSYNARLEVAAFLVFTRVQTSTGRLTPEGLAPTRFSDKFRTELAAHFERDKNVVTFSANTPQVPLLAGMQDQLSVFMQLAGMLAAAPAKYPTGTVITFETIGPRSPETWVLTVESDETLNLPGGEQATRKLTRKPRRDYDQTAELWLAPALGYLPVRIKLTEKNGDFVDQLWRGTEAP